ncbi:MAG: hypothetical protein H6725_17255 [Sandaracinaceae bacterium]|nr:hypothetical protein [Sandaracinaceae bacterium]
MLDTSPFHEGDVARIRGVVRSAGQTLQSRLNGTSCVYWDVRVGVGAEPEESDACAFWVEDHEGQRFLVQPERLQIDMRAERVEELVQTADADIAEVSAAIRQLKEQAKRGPAAQQAEAQRERRRLAKVATLLCAIRAEARGNVHVGGNPAGQQRWIAKNAHLAGEYGGRTIERRVARFEVALSEGDTVEVEGVLRRQPLPGGVGGGYRDRTDCWAITPRPTGKVRVLGVGNARPIRHAAGSNDAGLPALPRRLPSLTFVKVDPVLLITVVIAAVALATVFASR